MLDFAYKRFFRHIKIDQQWASTVRAAAERGSIVYVLPNVSLIDFLALRYLTKTLALPQVGFVNELSPLVQVGGAKLVGSASRRLQDTLTDGASAALFLRGGAGGPLSLGSHRKGHGDELLRTAIQVQQTLDREIMMVPQIFVWTQRPERLGLSASDFLFGPVDSPGDLRAAGQFLLNYRHCALRAGPALSLREFLAQQDAGADPYSVVRRLTYALLRKVERERRAIVGPAHKPVDRVRAEVLRTPKFRAVVRDIARRRGDAESKLLEQAEAMLQKLETAPDPSTLRALELLGDTVVERIYAGIDVDQSGLDRIRQASETGTLVYLPSHKSHVDYLLLSYVLRKSALQLPVIAAGDNLSFFPIGPLFRRSGAFFIRRQFKGDRLYAAVVDAYIRRLMRDGWAIEFFLEGARSRTGKLLPPKLGLLNMVIDSALTIDGHNLWFVPVSIGYERMMEEDAFSREVSGQQKSAESAEALLKLGEVLKEKYGRVNLQFGTLLSLAEVRDRLGANAGVLSPAARRKVVTRVAHRVMQEINHATAVSPGALVALSLLSLRRRGVAHHELVSLCTRLASKLLLWGTRTTPSLLMKQDPHSASPRRFRAASVREAALVYVRAGLVRQHVPGDTLTTGLRKRKSTYLGEDVIYTVPSDRRLALNLAKNHIVHFFYERSLVSTAMLCASSLAPLRQSLQSTVFSLADLLKRELSLSVSMTREAVFAKALRSLEVEGALVHSSTTDELQYGAGDDGLSGQRWILFYASLIQNFLESYRVAARTLRVLLRGALSQKELLNRALRVGEQMFLGGEVEVAEAVCGPTLENAFATFVDQGYLRRDEDRLRLAPEFEGEIEAHGIESKIAEYLRHGAEPTGW